MVNFEDSIDVKIFMSMQISKKCLERGENRPILILSNPGIGKSTAVSLFAEVNGYEEVLLRISNETPDTLTGYDIAATGGEDRGIVATSAKHIRPSWFQKILDNSAKGKKSVLFLDEITTSDSYVQGAALNLVFDRKCHEEKLPDDTLIVAAGNYAQNLTSEMNMLAPMLNRFVIINIIPGVKDLNHFFCKYSGAALGKRIDFKGEIKNAMEKLKAQEKDIPSNKLDQIGEMFQNTIKEETSALTRDGKLNLSVTDLKNIYSDVDNDDPVPNYITFRSANYLLDFAIACYECFGKSGIVSSTFKDAIHGTVGLAIARNGKNGEVIKTITTDIYYKALCETANDIEKMFNSKLPEYSDYLKSMLADGEDSELPVENITLLISKVGDMLEDKEVKTLDRPIDPALLKVLFKKLSITTKSIEMKGILDAGNDKQAFINDIVNKIETISGKITTWNTIARFVEILGNLISDPNKGYNKDIKETLLKFKNDARNRVQSLKLIRKLLNTNDPAKAKLLPDISTFKSVQ